MKQRFFSTMHLAGLLGLILLLGSCSSSKKLTKAELETLKGKIEHSLLFEKAFTGFALYDPERKSFSYEFQSDKYFTPASNTKILTYFTSRSILGDSMIELRYMEHGDSLIFWGTGSPNLLHPKLPPNNAVFQFLGSKEANLFFCPFNFQDNAFGKGWMWDDYQYGFQAPKAPFPIYGNIVRFERAPSMSNILIKPAYFEEFTSLDPDLGGPDPGIIRTDHGNSFSYNPQALTGTPFKRNIPFDYTPELFVQLLADTLGRDVQILDSRLYPPFDHRKISTISTDTLYKLLLQESDNFIAEQLMLQASDRLFGTLNTPKVIKWSMDSLLKDLPDPITWVDGSGLSRYNQMTPRSLVKVLEKIYLSTTPEKLKDVFPTGGLNGTIKAWYPGNPPYLFAKTGTMAHVHCLSGYLQTNSGKMLIFSFMHNHFKGSADAYKMEMTTILEWIRDNY